MTGLSHSTSECVWVGSTFRLQAILKSASTFTFQWALSAPPAYTCNLPSQLEMCGELFLQCGLISRTTSLLNSFLASPLPWNLKLAGLWLFPFNFLQSLLLSLTVVGGMGFQPCSKSSEPSLAVKLLIFNLALPLELPLLSAEPGSGDEGRSGQAAHRLPQFSPEFLGDFHQ